MKQRVEVVDCRIEITLNDINNTVILLELDKFGEIKNLNNYITSINVKEELSTSTKNPVGVVSSNVLTLELKSRDKSLVAENINSPYYGYLNDTAIIKVTLNESGEDIPFGTWYVDKWYTSVDGTDNNRVTIEAFDLFSTVGKSDTPDIPIVEELDTKQLLIDVINGYNLDASVNRKINYDNIAIDFSEFPLVNYFNIDLSSMSNCFNTISQATLTNILWSRDNKLVTDYVGDDTAKESVCVLSDMVNITSAKETQGALVNYNGVKVNYSVNKVNNPTSIVDLEGQALDTGNNIFFNIKFEGIVRKINYVSVLVEDPTISVKVKHVYYNKGNLNLTIESSGVTSCRIIIYGQTVNDSKLFIEKYKDNDGRSLLEMNNSVLPKRYVGKFADGMLKILGLRNSSIEVGGWFNPRIKLGDTVSVDIKASTEIEVGYYKVIGLDWFIGDTIKCNMRLMKVFSSI